MSRAVKVTRSLLLRLQELPKSASKDSTIAVRGTGCLRLITLFGLLELIGLLVLFG
jgi:hypothetical protein